MGNEKNYKCNYWQMEQSKWNIHKKPSFWEFFFFFAKESLVQAKEDCACSRLKITCGLSPLYGLFAG